MATRKQATVANTSLVTAREEIRKGLRAAGRAASSSLEAGVTWLRKALMDDRSDAAIESYRLDFNVGFIAQRMKWTDEQAQAWFDDPAIVKHTKPGVKAEGAIAAYNNAKVQWGRVKDGAGIERKPGTPKPAKPATAKPDANPVTAQAIVAPKFTNGAEALAFVAAIAKACDATERANSQNKNLKDDEWAAAREFFATVKKAAAMAATGKPAEMQQAA